MKHTKHNRGASRAPGRVVAVHEAGHAVAGYWLGRPFRYVTIISGNGSLGHVQSRSLGKRFNPEINLTPRGREIIDSEVSVCFAGPIAEKRFTKRWNRAGADADWRTAFNLASYIAGDEDELNAYLKWRTVVAEQLVTNRWNQIVAVAASLVERKRLTYAEVDAIIAPAVAFDVKAVT